MIEICALASGSNGNCYYIGNEDEAVLIDVGIYHKKLLERLEDAGLDKNKIKAAFISHEHTDHIQGARSTSNKLGVPVYYTKTTYFKSYKKNRAQNFKIFTPDTPVEVGKFTIHPFAKQHDAVDPCSFRVEIENKNIGVMTDIGQANSILQNEFSKCDAVFLEANYDEDTLRTGLYPYHLKERVSSSKGHLSNYQAIELIEKHASPQLKTIFLAHISAANNTHDIVREEFSIFNGKYDIKLCSRKEASDLVKL